MGSQVGPYVLLDHLGRGGMGEVFLGRDPRLDRSVALKCLLTPEGAAPDLQNSVVREARAAARISHPHVAAIYDVVEHDGRPFIVMEYVPGETLAALLKRGALAPARAVAIGREIAEALTAAHASGVVHRDLKPANIQVTPRGGIKILDFGIATALASLATTRTSAGASAPPDVMAGTPPYMSPEQRLGGDVDERSDLYSLAVILFEMTTGRRPFPSGGGLSAYAASMRRAPRADDVEPRVPRALADVIERGLASNPSSRFQSAGEMAAALGAQEADEERGEGSGAADAHRAGRHWQWTALGGAALGGAALGAVWTLGWIISAAFNNTMGRGGAFGTEPPLQYFIWGGKSLVAPIAYAAAALVAVRIVDFGGRVLAKAPAFARLAEDVGTRTGRLAAILSLDEPSTLAQGLATAGAAALGVAAWRFSGLINAWSAKVSIGPDDVLWRLGPANADEKILYRAVLTMLFVTLGAGLLRVLRLRRVLGRPGRRGGLAALVIVVLSALLMNEAPYRILWHSAAPRGSYFGARCYVIGATPADRLLFCPGLPPPRNRIVRVDDPGFVPAGIVESVFTAAGPAPYLSRPDP
ncbi:MAG: serine/threonine-protein kinase [Acidobacteriota bacterium]